MNRTIVSTSLMLAVAGFLGAGAAVAQQNNAPASTPPKTTPPITAPGMTTAPMPSTATPDAKAPTAAPSIDDGDPRSGWVFSIVPIDHP